MINKIDQEQKRGKKGRKSTPRILNEDENTLSFQKGLVLHTTFSCKVSTFSTKKMSKQEKMEKKKKEKSKQNKKQKIKQNKTEKTKTLAS